MWIRETLDLLTQAEFASQLNGPAFDDDIDANSVGDDESSPSQNGTRDGRNVDYTLLLEKVDRALREMCYSSDNLEEQLNADKTAQDKSTTAVADEDERNESNTIQSNTSQSNAEFCAAFSSMGSVVYTSGELNEIYDRLCLARSSITKILSPSSSSSSSSSSFSSSYSSENSEFTNNPPILRRIGSRLKRNIRSLNQNTKEILSTLPDELDPKLYVREDGTVDWDGALQGGEAAKKFGRGVWARINGQEDPDDSGNGNDLQRADGLQGESQSEDSLKSQVPKVPVTTTANIVENEFIKNMKEEIFESSKAVALMESDYNALLSSSLPPSSTVATLRISTLPEELRSQINRAKSNVDKAKKSLDLLNVNYDIERIYLYLDSEICSSEGSIPVGDRLAVAEFGLLEGQQKALNIVDIDNLDSDVLSVMLDLVTDFKRRLGIDYYVSKGDIALDIESLRRWLGELIDSCKKGLAFYGKGCKLLYLDIVFSATLFLKALQGYTLKPREVRTLRRTVRDFFTFIPFIIILIIPLTPVGHVFVFGAIQRFFPEFFPSCFTESRQNLLLLFESTEFEELKLKVRQARRTQVRRRGNTTFPLSRLLTLEPCRPFAQENIFEKLARPFKAFWAGLSDRLSSKDESQK